MDITSLRMNIQKLKINNALMIVQILFGIDIQYIVKQIGLKFVLIKLHVHQKLQIIM